MMMPPPIPTRPDKIPVAKPSKSEIKIVTLNLSIQTWSRYVLPAE
jgi:hypothetical protein